jgi:hypothetical protein
MDGIVGSLRLGWEALLLKEEAYEQMRTSTSPVVKGLILIVVVGLVIALFNIVGTGLELASTPDLTEIKDTVFFYMRQMPWWDEVMREDPGALQQFEEAYNQGWDIFPQLFGAPNLGAAAGGIIGTPLGLVLRWIIYGLVAYVFARWLGGVGTLAETLGVLALAVAPQALAVLTILPFVELGSLVSVWAVLCAYVGLKTAHRLSWVRAMWATLLPFILVIAVLILFACLGTGILGAVIGGQS